MPVARRADVLASMDSVYKNVLSTAKEVKRLVGEFQEFHLTWSEFKPERELAYIQQLCKNVGKPFEELHDMNDLVELLEHLQLDDVLRGSAEYQCIRVCHECSQRFDYISYSLKNKVLDAFEKYLLKLCLSFAPEAKGLDLRSVDEYQDNISAWTQDLQVHSEKLSVADADFQAVKKNFATYILEYNKRVHQSMATVCERMLRMCEPMKKWVAADSLYPRQLQEEISQYNKLKLTSEDKLKEITDNKQKQLEAVRRRQNTITQLQQSLEFLRENRNHLKRRLTDLVNNIDKQKADSERKKHDLQDAKSKLNSKKTSRAFSNYLVAVIETLKSETKEMVHKVHMSTSLLGNVTKDIDIAEQQINENILEIQKQTTLYDRAFQKVDRTASYQYQLSSNIRVFEEKLAALKTIREIKLNATTMNRINNFGYHPGESAFKGDELDDAIRITASFIGKDWRTLYHALPFVPERDFLCREKDVQTLDQATTRLGSATFRTVSLKSLEKWRRLHSAASVVALVTTLRRLGYWDVVKQLKHNALSHRTSPDLSSVDNVTSTTYSLKPLRKTKGPRSYATISAV